MDSGNETVYMIAPALIWEYSKDYAGWMVSTSERPTDAFIKVNERVDGAGWLITLMFMPFPRPQVVVANHLFARKMVEAWHRRNWARIPRKPWPTIKSPKASRVESIIERAERG